MSPRDQRRAYLALGASMAVHAAAGVALVRLGGGLLPGPPPRPAPLALALVQLPPVRRPPPAPAHAAPAAAPLPGTQRPGARGARGRGLAAPSQDARASPGASPTPVLPQGLLAPEGAEMTAQPPEPGSTAWLEAEGLSPAQAAPRPIGLAPPRGAGAAAAGSPQRPDLDPSLTEDRGLAAARVKDRIDGWFQELKAADRAENLPDVYWTGLRERLEAGWQVGWGVLDQGPEEDGVVSGSRVGQALESWQREAERWARGTEPASTAGPPELQGLEAARSLLSAHGLGGPGKPARALFVTELVTRVELEQGPDGAISSYRLVESSGNSAHDALVLARLRALAADEAERLGPPPEQGRRTRWAVRTRFEMVPPVPLAGCGFDAVFRITGCFYPLQRTVKGAVRLERVYDHPRPDEGAGGRPESGGGMEGATPSGAYLP